MPSVVHYALLHPELTTESTEDTEKEMFDFSLLLYTLPKFLKKETNLFGHLEET